MEITLTDIAERLRNRNNPENRWVMMTEAAAEIERLRAALQALHDWNVEYARINNLFNADGTPATFHELLVARRALEPKP